MRTNFVHFVSPKLSGFLENAADLSLVLMMLLTSSGIIGRAFGFPLLGTYELVSFGGGLVLSLDLPVTSLEKGHVLIDTLLVHLPRVVRISINLITRILAIGMFIIIAWSLLQMVLDLKSTGETSAVLELHYYPLLYIMAGAFHSEPFTQSYPGLCLSRDRDMASIDVDEVSLSF